MAWVAPAMLALTLAAPAHGEDNVGEVRGVVVDQQGALVANATVDIACGTQRRRITTSDAGEFTSPGLPAERCTVTASSDFFEPETIRLDSSTRPAVRLVLHVRRFASEVVVTPTRGVRESTFRVPETASVVSPRDLDARPYTLLLQALREEPGVSVQQTTSAQTSPIIRGFTGQSNVYLVDGVRLNTGAWRPGPSQYTAWVEPGAVDSIEVIRGGGSVQYGSDALGGTVQFLSGAAPLGVATRRLGATIEFGGASADLSVGGQADASIHARRASLRIGGSRTTVGDLRAGGGIDSHAAVTRFLGLPSDVVGSRLEDTSFTQGGAFAIADASPRVGGLLHGLYMHESQVGASRYDRLLGGEGLFRSGFDPQTLDFGMVRFTQSDAGGLNGGVSATFSVNRQADGRFEQSRPTARLDRQTAATTALGYQAQAHHSFAPRYQLLAGGEYYDERTTASRELVEPSGTITAARPDIPDDTTYTNVGLFAQQTADVLSDRLTLRGGVRYSRFGFVTVADPSLGITAEDVTMQSMTFQAAAVGRVNSRISITGNVSRAFRAANAADLGNIGLTGGGGFEITPSRAAELGAFIGSTGAASAVSTGVRVPALRPEVVYQYDAGVKTQAGPFSASVNVFDMELYDFIQRRALVFDTSVVGVAISGFEIVRQDPSGVAYIAQDARPIATRVNVDRARILGFEAEGEMRFASAWSARGYFSLANGRALPDGEYVRRMAPPTGGANLRWNGQRLWVEGALAFATEQTRLNSGDLGDARIGGLRTRASIASFFNGGATDRGLVRDGVLLATGETLAQVQNRVLGTASSAPIYTSHPGFVTVGLRTGVQLPSGFDLAVILENLGDVNYRFIGSGLDAPGFNAQVRTRYRF